MKKFGDWVEQNEAPLALPAPQNDEIDMPRLLQRFDFIDKILHELASGVGEYYGTKYYKRPELTGSSNMEVLEHRLESLEQQLDQLLRSSSKDAGHRHYGTKYMNRPWKS